MSHMTFFIGAAVRYPITNSTLDAGDVAILGRKGSGKTYTAKGLVERLIKRGRRVVVIDPMSIWWGLRLAADGTSAGLPILVVGGRQADIPFVETSPSAGTQLAKFILASDVSVVVDVADIRRPANLLFIASLLRELYEQHTGEPLWIVLEEADIWAPQSSRSGEDNAVVAEVEILARRGRSKGFRLISITQRPARLHKDVLSQFDTMAVLGLPGLHDRRAVRDWMEGVITDAREVYNTLPTLPVGEAWVWTPQQQKLVREKFPVISTYDTSATPSQAIRRLPLGSLSEQQLLALRRIFDDLSGHSRGPTRPRVRHKARTSAGAAIVRLRERLNLSQAELAALIGSEQKSISRMESGTTFVSTRILERIAENTQSELRVDFAPLPHKVATTE